MKQRPLCLSLPLLLLTTFMLSGLAEAQGGAEYRYYRFRDWVLKGLEAGPQISEVLFLSNGQPVSFDTLIQVTNEAGNTGSNERPGNLVDNDVTTKWYDDQAEALVFEFQNPVAVDSMQLSTANDVPGRDPIGWRFEGSHDAQDWVELDVRQETGELLGLAELPNERQTQGAAFDLNLVNRPPTIVFTGTGGGLTSSRGVRVESGGSVTLNWDGGAATTALLNGSPVSVVGSQVVTVSSDQTFTFSATTLGGTTTSVLHLFSAGSVADLRLNEVALDNDLSGPICDEEGDAPAYVEIFNPNPFKVRTGGLRLLNPGQIGASYTIPAGMELDADSYAIIFLSGKAASASEMRAPFTPPAEGEIDLELRGADDQLLDALRMIPRLGVNVSFGRTRGGGFDQFNQATPGAANTTPPGALGPEVLFSEPTQSFVGTLALELSSPNPQSSIRFTLDGTVPTETNGNLYTGTQVLNASTLVRARTFTNGFAPGPVRSQGYTQMTATLSSRTRTLPVVVVERFNAGDIGTAPVLQDAYFSLYDIDGNGEATPSGVPTFSGRVGLKRSRGSGSEKISMDVRFYQEGSNDPQAVQLLGMSTDSEWKLYAPYQFDTSLIRTPFLSGLMNEAGFMNPRARLVEVYFNREGSVSNGGGGSADNNDYYGVYVLMETPTVNEERIDIDPLRKNDNEAAEVDGGYVFRIDVGSGGGETFRSTLEHPLGQTGTGNGGSGERAFYVYESPSGQELTDLQKSRIVADIDAFEAPLFDGDASTDWELLFDEAAAVDHNLFSVFIKDPDALRRSTYLYRERGGKISFGPLWLTERGLSASNDGRSWNDEQWLADSSRGERPEYFNYEWWDPLFKDQDFSSRWIDRWQELRGTVLADAAMEARIDALIAPMGIAQRDNFLRWPRHLPQNQEARGAKNFAGTSGRVLTWEDEVNHLKGWVKARARWIDGKLRRIPEVTRQTNGVQLRPLDGQGYYTTNGEDPRLPGGGINPSAVRFLGTTTVPVSTTTTFLVRAFSQGFGTGKFDAEWSGLATETVVLGGNAAESGELVLSEIMYRPTEPSAAELAAGFDAAEDFEYLEFQNVTSGELDLSGVQLRQPVEYRFPVGTIVPAGEGVLLAANPSALQLRYGSALSVSGTWDEGGRLPDGGARIVVLSADGSDLLDFTYNDDSALGWPLGPDGSGRSLTLNMPYATADPALAGSWRSSVSDLGSPGQFFDDYCEEWKASFFSIAEMGNVAISGDEADPDGDGLGNLLELGLGLDPRRGNVEPDVQARVESLEIGGTSEPFLTVTYVRVQGVGGLTVEPAFSPSLEENSWSRVGTLIRSLDLGNGTERVTYRQNTPLEIGPWFARVEVEK